MARDHNQSDKDPAGSWSDWIEFIFAWGVIQLVLTLPYRIRLAVMAWIIRYIVGPLSGYRARAEANLAYIWPDQSVQTRRELANRVLGNSGRALIENFDLEEQKRRSAKAKIYGPGLAEIEKAQDQKRAVLLISGHFGNYTAIRSAIAARGHDVAALYRPWSNPYLNKHYMAHFGSGLGPAFPQGRKGTMGLVRHLNAGGIAALLFDVYDSAGLKIDFLGKPAPTLTSAADIALKTNALLVPCFATRHANGVDYEVCYEAPIDHSTPEIMMRDASHRLEQRVLADPDQWFWIHRRWKPQRQKRRQRKAAAARTGPNSGA